MRKFSELINENQKEINYFKYATGDGGADYYKWKNPEDKEFWYKLTQYILHSEREQNPNGYISELSKESQEVLVKIANAMLDKENKKI